MGATLFFIFESKYLEKLATTSKEQLHASKPRHAPIIHCIAALPEPMPIGMLMQGV